jgi:hypothetical protein
MGWGKGKGKAVERALHQAERQEEQAAMRCLRNGNIAGALEHERNAAAIENAEARWKGKGKGKAVERALHQAERQEEQAAMRALGNGNIAGALEHEKNAAAIENAEARWKGKGKGKGKGYICPSEVVIVSPSPVVAPVVVEAVPARVVGVEARVAPGPKGLGKATERALHRADFQQEAIAGASLACGDVIGAAIHAERASELKAAERAIHHDIVKAEARQTHRQEKRQEHLAARDLAHGNLLGAIGHEVKACKAHHREEKLKSELHHHREW